MANWIVGGALALLVATLVWKMIRDKRAGRSACNCGGDCSACNACARQARSNRANPD